MDPANQIALTTVVKVNGLNPDTWRADPNHLYVGRLVWLRHGELAGMRWPNSALGNYASKVTRTSTLEERREAIRIFERWVVNDKHRMKSLERMHGKVLGCWCGKWDGISQPRLLCHAAVYADWSNQMRMGRKPWEEFIRHQAAKAAQ